MAPVAFIQIITWFIVDLDTYMASLGYDNLAL